MKTLTNISRTSQTPQSLCSSTSLQSPRLHRVEDPVDILC
jgi:hypothetical protein